VSNRRRVKRPIVKSCENCEHCTYIGDGDYVCFADPSDAQIVKSEHIPTDDYFCCEGKDWSRIGRYE